MRIWQLERKRAGSVLSTFLALVAIAASAQSSEERQDLPDSPSAVIAAKVVAAGFFPAQASSSSSGTSQPTQSAQPITTQKPVGTAAAETPPTTGVAASNPSGAAIAPAKQRRVRTVFLRVGAILGVGAAVGTVAALATASPSKPPGSH